MGKPRLQLQGQTFGYFTVIAAAGAKNGDSLWLLRCVCGKEKILPCSDFRRTCKHKTTQSCGCMRRKLIGDANRTHGMTNHPAFWVWRSMRDRCRLPTHQAWKNYGGRGIRVCKKWRKFETFWSEMGPAYKPGLSIERKDNNGNYEKDNCYWATSRQQNSNRRDNRRIHTPWGFITVAEASRQSGIGITTLLYRLNRQVRRENLFDKPDTTRTFPR